jgi:hypothetical protein
VQQPSQIHAANGVRHVPGGAVAFARRRTDAEPTDSLIRAERDEAAQALGDMWQPERKSPRLWWLYAAALFGAVVASIVQPARWFA